MRTAVCVSGQCRSLDKTYCNISEQVLSKIGDYDLFVYTCDDGDTHKAALLKPTVVQAAPDPSLDVTGLDRMWAINRPIHGYLQQLYGLQKVNELRLAYEQETGTRYDWVIRMRPDSWFTKFDVDLSRFESDAIYVPQWGGFGWPRGKGLGLNDRFAIGCPAAMNTYFNQFDSFPAYAQTVKHKFVAEMATKSALQNSKFHIQFIDVRFDTVRKQSVISARSPLKESLELCRWEYGFLEPQRPFLEKIIACSARISYHLKRIASAKRSSRA